MGLFAQRPQEPSEWAGLPAEPQRPRTRAEMLPDAGEAAIASPAGLPGVDEPSLSSVRIPLASVVAGAAAPRG